MQKENYERYVWIGLVLTLIVIGLLTFAWLGESARIAEASDAVNKANVSHGRTLYVDNCTSCHGTRGEGGLGNDLSDLPIAGAAPEWMSEKAVAIGFYFVASGVYTIIGHPLPMMGSQNLYNYLTNEIEQEVGGKWAFEPDAVKAAHMMIRHIDKKRKALKLKPLMYEQPLQPEE